MKVNSMEFVVFGIDEFEKDYESIVLPEFKEDVNQIMLKEISNCDVEKENKRINVVLESEQTQDYRTVIFNFCLIPDEEELTRVDVFYDGFSS